MKTHDHPGVYVPPPLIYAAFFGLAALIQKILPLNSSFLDNPAAHSAGWILIALNFILALSALSKFARTKNTLVTIKPARSLQTNGIFTIPRYMGFLVIVNIPFV